MCCTDTKRDWSFVLNCRMNGHEVAIDRATPKDDGKHFVRPQSSNQRRSFDNGANIVGPGLTPLMNYQPMGLHADAATAAAFQSAMRALSLEGEHGLDPAVAAAAAVAASSAAADMAAAGRTSYAGGDSLGSPTGDDLGKRSAVPPAGNGLNGLLGGLNQNDFGAAALQNLMKAHAQALAGLPMPGMGVPSPLGGIPADLSSNAMFNGGEDGRISR
jgi:hypothetical protein